MYFQRPKKLFATNQQLYLKVKLTLFHLLKKRLGTIAQLMENYKNAYGLVHIINGLQTGFGYNHNSEGSKSNTPQQTNEVLILLRGICTQRTLTFAAVYTSFLSVLNMHHWHIALSNIHAGMSYFLSTLWVHCS